jgi:hypothetical protein
MNNILKYFGSGLIFRHSTRLWVGIFFLLLGIVGMINISNKPFIENYRLNSIALLCWGIAYILASNKFQQNWNMDENSNPINLRMTIVIVFEMLGMLFFLGYMLKMFELF